jgi:hypothetical protein
VILMAAVLDLSCRLGKVVAAEVDSGRGEACRNQAVVTTAPGEVSQQQQQLGNVKVAVAAITYSVHPGGSLQSLRPG